MPEASFAPPSARTRLPAPLMLGLVLTLAALLIPVVAVDIPPLSDYPNHLSRIWLLGGGVAVPPVSSMYQVTWDTLTNIGLDLIAVVLTKALPWGVVGRIIVGATVLLLPIGGVALWRALHGRLHWWLLAFALLAWNDGLVAGFMNFELGLGLAMLAASADPFLSCRGPALCAVARAILGGLLLMVHPFGFLFYATLLVAIALGADLRVLQQRRTLRRAVTRVAVASVTLAAPLVLLVLLAPSLPGAHAHSNLHTVWWDIHSGLRDLVLNPLGKLRIAVAGVVTYDKRVDALTLGALALPVLLSLALGRLRVHGGMLLVFAGLSAAFVLLPVTVADTFFIDRRFALMAPLALAVALRPDLPPLPARACAALLLVVSLGRTGYVGLVWHLRQADVAAVSRALASVPPGAAILPLTHQPLAHGLNSTIGPVGRYSSLDEPNFLNLPTLALPWHHAFVPILFTARGEQPLRVLPPWNEIAVPTGAAVSVHALVDPAMHDFATAHAPYVRLWRERFDYVLVINADLPDAYGPFVPPPGLDLLADEGFAQLYKIERPAP